MSSATPACPALSSDPTSTDKSRYSRKRTQKQKLSPTSAADSTSKGKDCAPYWNDLCVEIASQLWLPTVTDSAASVSTSSRGCLSDLAGASWFSTTRLQPAHKQNLFKIYSPSSACSPLACTDSGSTEKRSRKIRIYPTAEQRKIFRGWLGTSRKVYNNTVAYFKTIEGPRPKWTQIANEQQASLPEWAAKIPYTLKRMAAKAACLALSTGKIKAKATGEPFELHFRRKRDPVQSCFIPNDSVTVKGVYPRISGSLLYSEPLPEKPCDSRLLLDHGRWYLCVPYTPDATPQPENHGRLVALDPGVRTFMAYFSSDEAGWLCRGDFSRIVRLCQQLDNLLSRAAKAKCEPRHRMKKAADRIRWKIRELVDEMQWKVITFLLDRFDVIILPPFETSDMVKRAKRRIGRKSGRSMLTWAHYRFAQRLIGKARVAGKEVVRSSEAWTSKTMSWCGEVKHNLGGAKVIRDSRGTTVDRDINGARGIFLRALSDSTSPLFGRGAFVGVQ